AELVGVARPRYAPIVYLGPLDEARRDALAAERRASDRRTRYRPLMEASDDFRTVMGEVMTARAVATAAGPRATHVWTLLRLAAAIETQAHADLAEITA